MLMIFFVWHASQKNQTRQASQNPIAVNPVSTITPPTPPPVQAAEPVTAPKPIEASIPTNAPTLSVSTSPPEISIKPPIVVAPVPKPAPPKLQAIFFNPRRPSAILSGKTVFIGDRFGEFRVAAITQTSVTLSNAAQSLVLSLE
jgi:hypothetical protein